MTDGHTDIAGLLALVRRRGWILVLSVTGAVAAAWGVTQLVPPRYEATATLFVGARAPEEDPAIDLQYTSLAQSLVSSYAELAKTRAVAEEAAKSTGLPPERVIGQVEVESEPGLQILRLRARAAAPAPAVRLANALAGALEARVERLDRSTPTSVRVQLVDPAVSAGKVSPRLLLNLVFGGLVGLLAGIAVAVARERLDARIRTVEDAERQLSMPVLGAVPKVRRRAMRGDALARHANPEIAEPHRSLAVVLTSLAKRAGARRILVTSSRPEEGKTTFASHLALALVEDNATVALLEGDLRRPSLREHFPADEAADLNDVLFRTADLRLPKSSRVLPGLDVLPAGESHPDAGLILRAPPFGSIVEAALGDHDFVILDAPPAVALSDASILARHADAVALVIRAGAARAEDVRAAHAAFTRLGVEVVGAVLVGVQASGRGRYGYYGRGPAAVASLQRVGPSVHEERSLKGGSHR